MRRFRKSLSYGEDPCKHQLSCGFESSSSTHFGNVLEKYSSLPSNAAAAKRVRGRLASCSAPDIIKRHSVGRRLSLWTSEKSVALVVKFKQFTPRKLHAFDLLPPVLRAKDKFLHLLDRKIPQRKNTAVKYRARICLATYLKTDKKCSG